MITKHVGRIIDTHKRVAVAYRVCPGDPDYCLVVYTESLEAEYHDSLIKLIESNAGQTAYELAEAMARTTLPDGRNMLSAFHYFGKIVKIPTSSVEMVLDSRNSIVLAELNQNIAEQKGVTVDDLAIKEENSSKKQTSTEQELVLKVKDILSKTQSLQLEVDILQNKSKITDPQFNVYTSNLLKEVSILDDKIKTQFVQEKEELELDEA